MGITLPWILLSENRKSCYVRSAWIDLNSVWTRGADWHEAAHKNYPLVIYHSYWKSPFLMGKTTINGPCSIAMLVYQRVLCYSKCFSLKTCEDKLNIGIYDIFRHIGYLKKYPGALLFASKQLLMLAHGCSSLQNCRTWQVLTHAHIPTTSIGTLTALCWLVLISPAKSLS